MRTTTFRGILHAIAYKLGEPPNEANFLTGRAVSLSVYINQWVRKLWDSADFPEWTRTGQFAPSTKHIVPYESIIPPSNGTTIEVKMGRVLRVYLADPATTAPGPIDTPFRLTDRGVHCGFEHGANVWIKYLPFAPQFTSVPWQATARYSEGHIVLATNGECYKSLINNNIGIDPTLTGQQEPPPDPDPPPDPEPPPRPPPLPPALLPTEVTQAYAAPVPAMAGTSEEWRVAVDAPAYYALAGTIYTLTFLDTNGFKHEAQYTTPGAGGTVSAVLNGLAAAVAAGDAFLTSLTVAIELPNKIKFTLASNTFSLIAQVDPAGPTLDSTNLGIEHLSNYTPALAPAPATPQKTNVFLDPKRESLVTVYTVAILEAGGVTHSVEYESAPNETLADTMAGIATAINEAAATDAFWGGIVLNADAANNKFELVSDQITHVDATAAAESLAWELIPFPLALADAVIRGAYSDALREEGQTDKAQAEEQGTTAEAGLASSKPVSPTHDALSDQVRPRSRYRVEAGG